MTTEQPGKQDATNTGKLWGGRFAGGPSPELEALSRSTHFDWRLTPYDLAGSRAHANALHRAGLLVDADHAELLRGLSPEQRNLAFGFPLPGHPFWDRGTATATAARYNLDPAPYLDALPPPERPVDAAEEEAAESFIFGGPEGRGTSVAKPEGWMPLPPAVWEAPAQVREYQCLLPLPGCALSYDDVPG